LYPPCQELGKAIYRFSCAEAASKLAGEKINGDMSTPNPEKPPKSGKTQE